MATIFKIKVNVKKILLCFFFFWSLAAPAQFTLSTLYTGWFLPKNDSLPRMDRVILTANWQTLTSSPPGVKISPFSAGASVTRVFDMPFSKHLGIGLGIGFSWHNIRHNGEFITEIRPDETSYTHWQPFAGNREYKINKLTLIFLDGVFQFRVRFGELYGFRIYPGFKGGYLISDYRKYKDDDSKMKIYNTNHLMQYRYGPTVHISYGNFAVSGFYSLTPLFEKDKGVPTQVISLGISYLFI